MKALNHKEITKKYILFLVNFTVLLAVTVICYFFYLKTDQQQSRMIIEKKNEHDYIFAQRLELEKKVDSLTHYLDILTTDRVGNKEAMEDRINRIKNSALQTLERLKANGDPLPYLLFDKVISSVNYTFNSKHTLLQVKTKEEQKQRELDDCDEVDERLKRKLSKS